LKADLSQGVDKLALGALGTKLRQEDDGGVGLRRVSIPKVCQWRSPSDDDDWDNEINRAKV